VRPHGRPCPRGHISASARTRFCVRADAVFTASAGKCGRGRMSGRAFSSKNVRYDIPGRNSPFIVFQFSSSFLLKVGMFTQDLVIHFYIELFVVQ
jgi:hypothetical protein